MKLLAASLVMFACFGAGWGVKWHKARDNKPEFCQEIQQAMRDSFAIKSGTTRQELEKLFEEDGGATTRVETRYLYKRCPYIQVKVYFKPATPRDSIDPLPADTVIRVSAPYLASPAVD